MGHEYTNYEVRNTHWADRLIVLNLNRATTSTYVPQTPAWLTDPTHRDACDACPIHGADECEPVIRQKPVE